MTTNRVRLRPEIVASEPYRQGRAAAEGSYKLSSNENPFEPLPAVLEAISRSKINRYPDGEASELRARLAKRFGVDFDEVHVGAGSVSILSQLINAAAGPEDEVVFPWRSFEAYPGLVTVAGAKSVRVANTPDHRHDTKGLGAAVTDRTRVVIVCSPNNPTSTLVTAAEFDSLMAEIPPSVLVLLDEAYAEFVTDESAVSGTELTGRYSNLVVLRTFSKAYGLAGLRIGYAVGPDYLMDAARSAGIPLSVTDPAQRAAMAALDHEPELLQRVTLLVALRDRVWQALVDQGWNVPRPAGNFLWLPTGEETERVASVFADHGIVGRPFAGEGIRVSIGESSSVDKLLRASASVVATVGRRPVSPR